MYTVKTFGAQCAGVASQRHTHRGMRTHDRQAASHLKGFLVNTVVKRVLSISMAFVGLSVGAGFASGQEVLQFFVKFGMKGVLGAQDTLHAELDEELQNLLTGGEARADAEADESHRDTQHAFNHGVHEKTFQVRGGLPIMRSHPPMRVSLAGHSGALGTERFNSVHNH